MRKFIALPVTFGFLLILPLLRAQNVFSPEEIADTYLLSEVDSPPKAIHQESPEFSNNAVITKGFVRVAFIITVEGTIRGARVTGSSDRSLEKPILKALDSWRYEPARKGEQPVAVRVLLPIRVE